MLMVSEQAKMPKSQRDWETVAREVRDIAAARKGTLWYLVHCLGRDQHVLEWLERLRFETYYPAVREMKAVPRKRLSAKQRREGVQVLKPVLKPLLPRYIFARFDMGKSGWREMFSFVGVGGLVCASNLPVYVTDAYIKALREREVDGVVEGKVSARLVFDVGDVVRLNDGPFLGFDATVERALDKPIEDMDGDERIRVAVSLFGRANSIEIPLKHVDLIKRQPH